MPFGVSALPFVDRANVPAATVVDRARLAAVVWRWSTGRARQHRADALLVEQLGIADVVEGVDEPHQHDRRGDPAAVGVHGLDAFDAVGKRHLSADVRPGYGAAGPSPAV